MDFGSLGTISLDLAFLSSLLSIVAIDLVLAGDNAVVIAMAVRSLPHDQRKKGIFFGAGAAVLLRVVLTYFVALLLNISYVKLVGGILILWIAVKLFVEGAPEDGHDRKATSIWQAIKIIIIADITMSLDNMLAVGGASHGNMFLLLFGLGLSIPLIVFTSNLLSTLMDKFPVIIYAGAAILGKVGGEMMITDPFTTRILPDALLTFDRVHPLPLLLYCVEAVFAAGVIITGKLLMKRVIRKEEEMEVKAPAAQQRAGARGTKAILTISREFGSGGREIGRAVAKTLGYAYVDRESILADIKKDGPKWEQWATELDEHRPTVWEKFDWSFRGFAALVQLHILEHAEQGGVVIMGRGANFVLKGVPHAYRIRVTSPREEREERIVTRESVDRQTAYWLCEKTDRERAGFLHSIYGGRWDDPAEYDHVFTVSGQSVDPEVREVVDALANLAVTDEGLQALRLRLAAARVKAGIAVNQKFFVSVFDVLPDADGLILRGIVHTPKEHQQIEDEALRLAGETPIRFDLHYRK
ncbi:MAG: YjbE family putative metal transport protein [Candidatus Methylomirabilia bacterium]